MIDPAIEQRLVAELGSRDASTRAAALGELYDHVGERLRALCLRVACDRTDADDAVQETFVDVMRGLSSFRAESRLSTWIFRIAIRAAMRVRNRRGRVDRRGAAQADESHAGDPALDPGVIAIEREGTERVLAAIERLDAPQRAVLALAALDDVPQTEIAAILGVPVGTVYSRLFAARENLRAELARRA